MYTYTAVQLQAKTFGELKSIARELNVVPSGDRRCRQSWIDVLVGIQLPLLQLLEVPLAVEVESVQEPIAPVVEIPPGVEVESVQEAIESSSEAVECPFCGAVHGLYVDRDCLDKPLIRCLHCSYCTIKHYPGPILLEAEEPPIYKPETKHGIDLQDLTFQLQEPIALVAKTSPGVTFSDRFLARYSPPQPEIHYQADTDGQLTLLDFEVESQPEPPDPDDFESLDAFREAIALWDAEHPEPLEISLDSFCEWAPCPDDWYEPDILLELSEVMEVLLPVESSSTCKFLIPVFGALGDRANRYFSDEPPTAGVGARLPKPKPPSFPPLGVAVGDRVNRIKFARSATLLSGRAPPGGDAVF